MLRHGDVLLEASGGNTAISLAMIAAAKGYALTLVMPDTVPPERKRLLDAYGAKIVFTSPSNGMKGSVGRVVEIFESTKRAVMINQFENPMNPEVHRTTTGVEILKDLGTVPDVFVAGVGTGGTITGVGELSRKRTPVLGSSLSSLRIQPYFRGGIRGPTEFPASDQASFPRYSIRILLTILRLWSIRRRSRPRK